MKVVLIWPRLERDTNFPPLGILYVAAVLEQSNHKLLIIDGTIKKEEIEKINNFNPDLIGVSITTSLEKNAKESINTLKQHINKPIVIGGVHITALMKDIFKEFDVAYAIYGEAEYSMRDFCNAFEKNEDLKDIKGLMYKKNNQIILNPSREPIQNLDELPFPARHLLDFSYYLSPPGSIRGEWLKNGGTTIMSSRGCPFQCIYCGSQTTFGRKVRRRSVDNVFNEIVKLKQDYNLDGLWFVDDTFTLDNKWVIELCKKITEKNLKLKWACHVRVDTLNEEMLREMKRAGCVQVEMGIESGSDKVLTALKKGVKTERVIEAFKLIKKVGLSSLATFIIGSPEETKEDVQKTLDFAKKIKPDFALFFNLIPFPGTELYEMAKKNNWIKNENYAEWLQFNEPVMTINLSKEEQSQLRNKLQDSFLLNNYKRIIFNPKILYNVLTLTLTHPRSLMKGITNLAKKKNLDAFIYGFLESYRAEIKGKQTNVSPSKEPSSPESNQQQPPIEVNSHL
tara:strand:+ start:701 stop:2230 length:1530 start_codon:yes stop_codon:yes gene_type:complete